MALIVHVSFPLAPDMDLSPEEIAYAERLYRNMLPATIRDTATCKIVEAHATPDYAERMMERVRAEFAAYDHRPVFRPRKTYYRRPMGEQAYEGEQ